MGSALLLWSGSVALQLLAAVPLAIFLHQSYIIVHECTHGSFLKTKRANLLLGHIYGLLSLLPFYCRKYEHIRHHTWAGNLIHEPATRRAMAKFLSDDSWLDGALKVCWRLWIPILSVNEHLSLWALPYSKENGLSPKQLRNCFRSIALTVVGLVIVCFLLVYFETGLVAWLSIFAGIFLFFLLIEIYNLPHHLDAEVYDSDKAMPLWKHDALTRSGTDHGWISKLLFLNFNRHVEHHFYPSIPWDRLPEVTEVLSEKMPEPIVTHEEWVWNFRKRNAGIDVVFAKYLHFLRRRNADA